MKAMVGLRDSLVREAKRMAVRAFRTFRVLVERGLRIIVGGRRPAARLALRTASFRGDGLAAGASLRDWESVRDLTYAERGTWLLYWATLRTWIGQARVSGARIHDARVAALCLAHAVRELWTSDRDFSMFPALRTRNPLIRS